MLSSPSVYFQPNKNKSIAMSETVKAETKNLIDSHTGPMKTSPTVNSLHLNEIDTEKESAFAAMATKFPASSLNGNDRGASTIRKSPAKQQNIRRHKLKDLRSAFGTSELAASGSQQIN